MVVPTPVGRPECCREQSGLTGVLPTLEIEYSVTTVAPAQPFPKLRENDRTGMHATVAYTSNNLPDAGHAAAQDTAYDALPQQDTHVSPERLWSKRITCKSKTGVDNYV